MMYLVRKILNLSDAWGNRFLSPATRFTSYWSIGESQMNAHSYTGFYTLFRMKETDIFLSKKLTYWIFFPFRLFVKRNIKLCRSDFVAPIPTFYLTKAWGRKFIKPNKNILLCNFIPRSTAVPLNWMIVNQTKYLT